MNGILLVDKPDGVTSAGVIRTLKHRFGRAKVGHLGTLDPFASGLLPLCIGEATKVARYLLVEEKGYAGRIQLGVATDTLDRTGDTVATAELPVALSGETLAALAARFTGPQMQTPPMYSALKRAGVPLYQLARQGIEVERAPRPITIHQLRLWPAGAGQIDFDVRCSKGTYIRVLAADIAVALGTVGHLSVLRRTAVGAFTVDAATPVDTLREPTAPLPLVGVRAALANLRAFTVPPKVLQALGRGQQSDLRALPPATRPEEAALLLDPSGAVGSVVEADASRAWRLVRMLQLA